MKNLSYWVVLSVIAYAMIELLSYAGLYVLDQYRLPVDKLSRKQMDEITNIIEQKTNYYTFSPALGWSIKNNGFSKLYQANSQGIRSDKEYELTPPHGVNRVLTFGDSFTHCDDVNNNETWQAIMEGVDSNLEVLNFGVGAFGLDQAYLRYLDDGYQYKSHIVLIGFMSEDIYRNVNTFRPFYYPNGGMPLAKPRFIITNNKLSLVPNQLNEVYEYNNLLQYPREVLRKLGVNDFYFQNRFSLNTFGWSPTVQMLEMLIRKAINKYHKGGIITNGLYNESSEAFIVTKRIFDLFYSEVINNNSMPVILIFPNKDDVLHYRREGAKKYSPLLSYFDFMGFRYIDLMDAFENSNVDDLFVGHYSPLGNRLVAKYIHNYLNNMDR